ncbi:multiple epidermal growth factor-like domains protein 6 isoform X2 [Magallana gigas]|uniref:multiple epidermal growth factor-like domains protein 6 isoform X2 n=2 Tax=Magallana gigas TaxID=29159 RepID=UPI00334101C7
MWPMGVLFYFITATNSLNKCNLRIGNLYTGSKYSIKSIDLIIGKEVTNFSLCPNSHRSNKNLQINCSSWITEEYIMWNNVYACSINDAQCVRINNYCVCHCIPGYILEGKKCLKERVAIGGTCEHNRQCKGTAFANVCDHDVCSCSPGYIQIGRKCYPVKVTIGDVCAFNLQCNGTKFATVCDHGSCLCSPGYIQIDRKCYPGNLGINDFCEQQEQCIQPFSGCFNGSCKCKNGYSAFNTNRCLKENLELDDSCKLTEQCLQPFSVCFHGKCKCMDGYSTFDRKSCLKDTVPVGGFCDLDKQCTGSNNSGTCEHERCTCAKEFTLIDSACEKNQPTSLGSSKSQQYGTNIGVTVGSLFGGFILGVIVTAVLTTLMYRRLNIRAPNRKEPDAMFVANRECGAAGGAQISFTNNKKQNVATLSPYSFAKETQGYNLSGKQEDERADDVYNHLHEQTEQDDDDYDHACAVTNHITDLSDYSNIHDAATFRPSPSKDGDDYSTLRN